MTPTLPTSGYVPGAESGDQEDYYVPVSSMFPPGTPLKRARTLGNIRVSPGTVLDAKKREEMPTKIMESPALELQAKNTGELGNLQFRVESLFYIVFI